ncbi:LysR family transcriptional regulator [Mesorhizobium sp. WSM2561]|uniref:LysR family transcriptional regulator n=1 Tax=Mesorhizobium sp. WSM2561 TaxID=1040985 RepID=UPI000A059077|nr:LysR family transcriptional regulator [Mesorhizobium sp. WSM2561]
MRRSIQLLTLHFATVVAQEGSFLGASRRLRIHHSALSRRIKDLELRLGVTLFERHPGGVRVTAAGDCFLTNIRRILKDLDDALQGLESAGHGDGQPLSIGSDRPPCHCSAVVACLGKDPNLPAFVAFLRKHHPEL